MASPDRAGFDLASTYVHLAPAGAATPIAVTPTFWQELASGMRHDAEDGWLVTAFQMTGDVTHWEMHPAGDELIVLLAGALDLILDHAGEERIIALRGRGACLVPRGCWHRSRVPAPSDVIFVTPGAGTEHRPL